MKPTSITKTRAISDDAPKLTQADFDRAHFRLGKQPVSRADWQLAVRSRVGKQRINIMLDAPIVDHFKSLAGERGYQTLINATLREAMQKKSIEETLRRVIREEMHPQ